MHCDCNLKLLSAPNVESRDLPLPSFPHNFHYCQSDIASFANNLPALKRKLIRCYCVSMNSMHMML